MVGQMQEVKELAIEYGKTTFRLNVQIITRQR